MTVHYLPITGTTVTTMNDVNGSMDNQPMTAGCQVVLPGGNSLSVDKRDNKEEDDDVDYYAHERKRQKQSSRSSGVYATSFIAIIFLK